MSLLTKFSMLSKFILGDQFRDTLWICINSNPLLQCCKCNPSLYLSCFIAAPLIDTQDDCREPKYQTYLYSSSVCIKHYAHHKHKLKKQWCVWLSSKESGNINILLRNLLFSYITHINSVRKINGIIHLVQCVLSEQAEHCEHTLIYWRTLCIAVPKY